RSMPRTRWPWQRSWRAACPSSASPPPWRRRSPKSTAPRPGTWTTWSRPTPRHAGSPSEGSRSRDHATRPVSPRRLEDVPTPASPHKAEVAGVTVLIAIAGLGFLILIHEAGHFFTALAVGMRPRRFYVGFPPALAKKTHNGVEYGLGVIPLGGYVKIPGMHRPAPSDLDAHFGPALYEAPRLLPAVERVKRRLEQSDFDGAREALVELREAVA